MRQPTNVSHIPPPPKPGDLLEGTLPRTLGRFRLVTKVTRFESAETPSVSHLVETLDLLDLKLRKAWWSSIWLEFGFADETA